jgi:hypothetical protein
MKLVNIGKELDETILAPVEVELRQKVVAGIYGLSKLLHPDWIIDLPLPIATCMVMLASRYVRLFIFSFLSNTSRRERKRASS